jgi:para-nitrobenzyl esterase
MGMDEAAVERWIANALPGVSGDEVVEAYRSARRARCEPVEPRDIWIAAGSDIVFRWPSLQLAAAHVARGGTAYAYLFDWESPAFDGILGSCHGLELPFVFGAVDVPVVQLFSGGGPAVTALSQRMQRAWLAFALAGDPSHDGIGPWVRWEPVRRSTMIFGAQTSLTESPRDDELALLERHRPLVGGLPG